MAAAGGGKDKIEWVKQAVPKFIQEFKERTNQKDAPTLDSKRKGGKHDKDESDEEREDETPLVCVSSSVTEEEAETFLKQSYGDDAEIRIDGPKKRSLDTSEEKDDSNDGKMTFNKPEKETKTKDEPKKKKSKMKKVKDTKLLSFGDQDEEEE